jgi:hypothetical protein
MQEQTGNASLFPIDTPVGKQEQVKRQTTLNSTEEVGFYLVAQDSYQKIIHPGLTSWVHYISLQSIRVLAGL